MATLTLADIYRDASMLEQGGTISVKHALSASILSAQCSLEVNARQYQILKKWLDTRLPADPDKVYKALKGTGGMFTKVKCEGLYRIEWLARSGQLDGLEQIGQGWEAQHDWRMRIYRLMHGHGMAYKTVSFAALLISPSTCEMVPVDRHVLARFGKKENGARSRKNYLAVERLVALERAAAGMDDVPLALWHWYMWELERIRKGLGVANGCESHALLSCRV